MVSLKDIVYLIELHDASGIRSFFEAGINPNELYNERPLIYELISEYTRSPAFKDCVRAFVDYGLEFEDPVLLAVLLNDQEQLTALLKQHPEKLYAKYSLRAAYTPLYQVSLLHICAEFNHVEAAEVLIQNGLSVNEPAGLDSFGFGGQTPLFHTVNQNQHQSEEMMLFLLAHGADPLYAVRGIIWGQDYEWETFIPSVNPLSYAMMGLLPQFHRSEKTIHEVIRTLLKHAYGIEYTSSNIPNRYLQKRS